MTAEVTTPEITALARVLPEGLVDDCVQLFDNQPRPDGVVSELQSLVNDAVDAQALCEQIDPVLAKPIANDVEEAAASELLLKGETTLKQLDEHRQAITAPVYERWKGLNGIYKAVAAGLLSRVEKRGRLERLILAYREEKRARIQREQEEAERKKREAAEAEAAALRKAESAKSEAARKKALEQADEASRRQTAAAAAAPMPMPKGTWTASGKATETTRYVLLGIHDYAAVPDVYKQDPVVVEALKRVLQKAIDGGARVIAGCSIGEEAGLRRNVGR